MGVSEWLLTGTTPDGRRVRVRGCDHWEFRGGKVIRNRHNLLMFPPSLLQRADQVIE